MPCPFCSNRVVGAIGLTLAIDKSQVFFRCQDGSPSNVVGKWFGIYRFSALDDALKYNLYFNIYLWLCICTRQGLPMVSYGYLAHLGTSLARQDFALARSKRRQQETCLLRRWGQWEWESGRVVRPGAVGTSKWQGSSVTLCHFEVSIMLKPSCYMLFNWMAISLDSLPIEHDW